MQIREIETIIADKLPASAYRYVAWWSNGISHNHTQCRAWLENGYHTVCVKDTIGNGYIIFEKQRPTFGGACLRTGVSFL